MFGNEEDADIKYKTLSWPLVAVLMIAEIVSNGMLSLPAATAVVGIVPGVILIVFLGKQLKRGVCIDGQQLSRCLCAVHISHTHRLQAE